MKRIFFWLILFLGAMVMGVLGHFLYWKFVVLPAEKPIRIFCYHKISYDSDLMSISPETFRAQLAELKNMGYYTVHLTDAYQYWRGEKDLPPGGIVLTFDDGYANNLSLGEPVLKEFDQTGTVFLIANRLLQWDLLDWDEVRTLQQKGWEIGSHSWSHIDLTIRPDFHGKVEIEKSRLDISNRSSQPVYWFAYPYGFWNEDTLRWVKKSGYLGAVTTRVGLATTKDDPYLLDRIPIIPSKLPVALDLRLRIWQAEAAEYVRWLGE